MYKTIENRKYTRQEREDALQWLKDKVRVRIPYATGPIQFTEQEVDQITADVQDDVNSDRLLMFLQMCWYNWVDDGGDMDGHRMTVTSNRGDKTLMMFLVDDGCDYPDRYSFGDIVQILYAGQFVYPFHSSERDLERQTLQVEAMNWLEEKMFIDLWFAMSKEQRKIIFEQARKPFPKRPAPRNIDPDDILGF